MKPTNTLLRQSSYLLRILTFISTSKKKLPKEPRIDPYLEKALTEQNLP